MSESASLVISGFDRDVTTHTALGAKTEPHRFVRLSVDLGASGVLVVELDAGDFSRALADPGTATPVAVELGRAPRRAG